MPTRNVLVELVLPRTVAVQDALTFTQDSLRLPGFRADPTYPPVGVPAPGPEVGELSVDQHVVIIRGSIEAGQEAALEANPNVRRVWSDARVEPFRSPVENLQLAAEAASGPCAPWDCDAGETGAKGDIAAVAQYLGSDRVWQAGYRGRGIEIGICDVGVRRSQVANLVDGWSPPGGSPWGDENAAPHGTMCATDALGQCPDAHILDIGILKSQAPNQPGDPTSGLLSDALSGYDWAIQRYQRLGSPQVLSNSWGIYQQSWGPDYAADPQHPFTRKVLQAIDAGILVCFAAGNCGAGCPSSRCGDDSGPGRSIWGANGHPRVITVGACNIHDQWIGYTSQGPAALDPHKPDVCAPSHYRGFTANDNGTSAACPTLAGVLGLLRNAKPALRQEEAKAVLQRTARTVCGPGWDANAGSGAIQAYAAFQALRVGPGPQPQPSQPPARGVQFRGSVSAGATVRWSTTDWPSDAAIAWSVVPTTIGPLSPQIRYRVSTSRQAANRVSYFISVTNLTTADVQVEARYAILNAPGTTS